MTEILDSRGRPIPREAPACCAACGASPKHQETTPGFGGYWSKTCTHCGHVVASGRGDITPEVRA